MADGDLNDPIDYGSTVRNNLMKRPLLFVIFRQHVKVMSNEHG